ncbi:MAG: sugar phosphate isomerase/epimerase [Armatimonadota bacterium]|nr:MAG: sugar phosphate isomerase/epimerase [Armatimonadota bacterium]
MRFAFCNEGFGDRPWSAVCSAIAKAGYDGVEIAPFTLAETVRDIPARERADIRAAAHDAGLEIVGLHWLLVKPEGLHVSHPDSKVRARTRDYLCHLADFCADLGGEIMVFGSPRQRGRVDDASSDDTWRWAAETFCGALPTAAERGVTLCIEALGTDETDFVTTAADARRLVDEIGHPSFRLILDVKAMSSEDVPIPDIIRQQRDVLAHVHANDRNGQGPGFGDTDFHSILKALSEMSYDGYISVEPFEFLPDVDTVARRCIRYLRECLPV